MSPNHVRRLREVLGLNQKEVATAIGVSRQTLNAVETGRSVPSVTIALKLARVLSSDVESLFSQREGEMLKAHVLGPRQCAGSRVALGFVRERWVAHPLSAPPLAHGTYAADGFVRRSRRGGTSDIELSQSLDTLRNSLFIGGCAPGLGVLCDRLNGGRGPGKFRWLMQANPLALRGLLEGHTHLAGVHLPKGESSTHSATLARHVPPEGAQLFALASWEAGLVIARSNPKRLRSAADLARPGLRFAVREAGSGAHVQLERILKSVELSHTQLRGRAVVVRSHVEVASAVQLGAADVGFTIRAAAQAADLDFLPLLEERFDLIVPADLNQDPRVLRLLETVSGTWFRRELLALGYDSSGSGESLGAVAAR